MSSKLSTAVSPHVSGERISATGRWGSRYALVVVLAWIGSGKFVKMEAHKLILDSPLMSWLYDFLSRNAVADSLGTLELLAAALIAVRPFWPRVSAAGSVLAIILFLGTLSFLFTTSGVVQELAGPLPVLSGNPGQFLLKDLVLIGVALWTLGDSLIAARAGAQRRAHRL
ncbi:DUF417 family protein [Amycolatopsis sp. NPDC051371]|uniref:DUF417 family protein n=1 Tax=Amycolatopsis sp. NPDC051371 TaxID=3155800 RepID=UPI0034324DC3